jgi:hypothetical protein
VHRTIIQVDMTSASLRELRGDADLSIHAFSMVEDVRVMEDGVVMVSFGAGIEPLMLSLQASDIDGAVVLQVLKVN